MVLRERLLCERAVAIAGGAPDIVCHQLHALGARVEVFVAEELAVSEEEVGDWARARTPLHGLLHWTAESFGDGGPHGLRAAVEESWVAVREVATGALIPQGSGGKLLLVGPRANAGAFAQAARAALENLARTLSVEWARYSITAVMIAPGASTTDEEIAQVAAYLLSPAGDYLSGARLELGAVDGAAAADA